MTDNSGGLTRRKTIGLAGAALTTAVAGCSGSDDEYQDGDDSGGDGSGNGSDSDGSGGSLELGDHELVEPEDEFGSPTVEGTVDNTGDETVSYAEVRARVYDADGNQLDNYFTNTTDLAAGKSWAFEIMIVEDMADIDDYDISVSDSPF